MNRCVIFQTLLNLDESPTLPVRHLPGAQPQMLLSARYKHSCNMALPPPNARPTRAPRCTGFPGKESAPLGSPPLGQTGAAGHSFRSLFRDVCFWLSGLETDTDVVMKCQQTKLANEITTNVIQWERGQIPSAV